MMSYEDLKYFQKVAQTGSLRKAALTLNISQPSLSYTVKKLEDKLGVALLRRTQKGVVLTKQGEIFLGKVEQFLWQWEDLTCEVTSETNRLGWQMTIGCHPSVAKYTLPKFLPEFLKNYPKLKVKLVHGLSREITNQVVDGVVDLGLVINPVSQPDLIIKKLATDIVTLWESQNNVNKDVLIFDPALAQCQWILRQLEKHKIQFNRYVESCNLEVISKLVTSGAGVGILPSRTVEKKNIIRFLPSELFFKDVLCAVFKQEFKKKLVGRELITTLDELWKN